jgi:hypothetical protein
MTELKHGSNVAGLQTEAILDVHTDEWIVNVRDPGWLACVLYVYGTPGKLRRLKAALFPDEGVVQYERHSPTHAHAHTFLLCGSRSVLAHRRTLLLCP